MDKSKVYYKVLMLQCMKEKCRDGFEASICKAKAMASDLWGHSQIQWSSRPRSGKWLLRPRPDFFKFRAKATISCLQTVFKEASSWEPHPWKNSLIRNSRSVSGSAVHFSILALRKEFWDWGAYVICPVITVKHAVGTFQFSCHLPANLHDLNGLWAGMEKRRFVAKYF